jgi:hypothetical protein
MVRGWSPFLPITSIIYRAIVTANDVLGNSKQRQIEVLKEDELPSRLNSQIIPVTTYDPVGYFVSGWDLQLYPQSTQSGVLFYLKRPAAPVFAYTLISARVIVYNQGASTQLEWSDPYVEKILLKALQTIGINAGEADIEQWAQSQNQQQF